MVLGQLVLVWMAKDSTHLVVDGPSPLSLSLPSSIPLPLYISFHFQISSLLLSSSPPLLFHLLLLLSKQKKAFLLLCTALVFLRHVVGVSSSETIKKWSICSSLLRSYPYRKPAYRETGIAVVSPSVRPTSLNWGPVELS